MTMKVRSALLISGLAVAALVPGTWAIAAPLDKGHFDDVFTGDDYDCDGTPAQDNGDIHVNFLFNQRGSSAFPYYRESVHGTVVTTNLNTGGTYTNEFAGSSKDQTIVDNGDGTITITVYATGGSRWYDQHGRLVLKDPGNVRFAFDVDYNGTPGNPEDDSDVPDSFRIIRDSTGRNDTEGRDFCADLVQFTT
jgi:hypothetical protein